MSVKIKEHQQLLQGGLFQDALRLSGEELALAESRLAKVRELPDSAPEKAETAKEFLTAASMHLADLSYAGMERDEAALAVSVIATLLVMKVNPETIPDHYIHWLQMTVGRLGDILPQTGEKSLEEPFWQLAQLAVATCEEFSSRMQLDASVVRTNGLIKEMIVAADNDAISYEGQKIVPQMAIDITFNMLNLMGSLGWIQ